MPEFSAPTVKSIPPNDGRAARRRFLFVMVRDGSPFDLIGPLMVLEEANWLFEYSGMPEYGYDIEVVTNHTGTVFGAKGLRMEVDQSCYDVRGAVDTLVFQAGDAEEACLRDERFIDWVRQMAPRARRVVTACVGTFVLAEAGLLDGRRATTHWMACDDFRERYPGVKMDPEPIFVKDGKYYSSAGVSAILDLMLALVEEDFGAEVALRVAQSMVLFLRRPAGQSQFSVQLSQKIPGNNRIQNILAHIAENPDGELDVETLAAIANMSPRNFARVFTEEVGQTPGKYVELTRIEAARRQLEQSRMPISEVARCCGYRTPDGMRASFDRNLGVGPGEYRRRFATIQQTDHRPPA